MCALLAAPSVAVIPDDRSIMSTELIRPRAATAVLLVVAAVAATAIVLSAVAFGALALGADAGFAPLQPGPYLTFGIVGVLASLAGWVLIVRSVRRSARLLRVLVPVLEIGRAHV